MKETSVQTVELLPTWEVLGEQCEHECGSREKETAWES